MSTIRSFVYLIVIMMLLVSGCGKQAAADTETASKKSSTATPEPLPKIDPELQAALKNCENVQPGQACLAEGPVQVTAQPERNLRPFQEAGQTLNLADLQTLKLGEAGSTKGLVVMRIQTEWPGGDFRAVAFGDVELVNEVPYGTREFNPMQSLKLITGANEEGQKPTSGIFFYSPEDGNLSTLVVNGIELSFGSTGLLTSVQGGLTVQTVAGAVGAWTAADQAVEVKQGTRLDLAKQQVEKIALNRYADNDPELQEVIQEAYEAMSDPAYELTREVAEMMKDPEAYAIFNETLEEWAEKYRALLESRKKQKPWKGGWWKMTYGPTTSSGQCKGEAVGDGMGGEGGEPYTTEIPICRGNNGNTILMYESGTSYERIAPNLYVESSFLEYDFLGNGNLTKEGRFTSLQVVSPTRMILSNTGADVGGCTTASVVYLDYVRDDPNVRCGYITDISPYDTPEPPTPTPEPQKVDPPIEGEYQVRVGIPIKACDPAAKPYAPDFTSASLSLTAENKLVLNAGTTSYELGLTNLTYRYSTEEMEGSQYRLGIFSLHQPLEGAFNLTLSIFQMPGGEWTGNWLVANEDGSQLCSGSIDLLPPG